MIYFLLWHGNYHISLVATATHEIFIFIPLDENKSCIYRKNLNILYILLDGFQGYRMRRSEKAHYTMIAQTKRNFKSHSARKSQRLLFF
jgi:hypothetical protein